MRTRTKRLLALLAAGMTAAAPVAAQDTTAGESMYQNVCRNCHGPTGKGMASFPALAGRDTEYLTSRLEAYRAGEKVGSNTALMAPHAKDLSDEDIAALVAYITTSFE